MRVGLYGGAASGRKELHPVVVSLVSALADAGGEFVYGGGADGIMGLAAWTALAHGARVTGILAPPGEGDETPHPGLTRVEVATSRPARRARILALSDVVVALPGGPGTLEEIAEAVNLRRLGLTRARCAVLDAQGFFDPFLRQLDQMAAQGFLRQPRHELVATVATAREVTALCAGSAPGRDSGPAAPDAAAPPADS
ncbi:LOG family protein [Micromonospora sp. NPDC002575]|uniref:LOG family protein n=1 Tax=Micromonospora sp. NPDC002575 TaxID=3364222 RepID=UPI0036CA9371